MSTQQLQSQQQYRQPMHKRVPRITLHTQESTATLDLLKTATFFDPQKLALHAQKSSSVFHTNEHISSNSCNQYLDQVLLVQSSRDKYFSPELKPKASAQPAAPSATLQRGFYFSHLQEKKNSSNCSSSSSRIHLKSSIANNYSNASSNSNNNNNNINHHHQYMLTETTAMLTPTSHVTTAAAAAMRQQPVFAFSLNQQSPLQVNDEEKEARSSYDNKREDDVEFWSKVNLIVGDSDNPNQLQQPYIKSKAKQFHQLNSSRNNVTHLPAISLSTNRSAGVAFPIDLDLISQSACSTRDSRRAMDTADNTNISKRLPSLDSNMNSPWNSNDKQSHMQRRLSNSRMTDHSLLSPVGNSINQPYKQLQHFSDFTSATTSQRGREANHGEVTLSDKLKYINKKKTIGMSHSLKNLRTEVAGQIGDLKYVSKVETASKFDWEYKHPTTKTMQETSDMNSALNQFWKKHQGVSVQPGNTIKMHSNSMQRTKRDLLTQPAALSSFDKTLRNQPYIMGALSKNSNNISCANHTVSLQSRFLLGLNEKFAATFAANKSKATIERKSHNDGIINSGTAVQNSRHSDEDQTQTTAVAIVSECQNNDFSFCEEKCASQRTLEQPPLLLLPQQSSVNNASNQQQQNASNGSSLPTPSSSSKKTNNLRSKQQDNLVKKLFKIDEIVS